LPLSEDEQRILHEIEQQFYETDPAFAREVGSTSLYRHAFRNLKWATLGFIAGVVLLIYTLITTSFVVSFVCGFLVMLASALWFERNARKLGRAGLQQMTATMRGAGIRDYVSGAGKRVKDKFKKDKDE
jgi:thiosulfate reductase cytochrome b subunit